MVMVKQQSNYFCGDLIENNTAYSQLTNQYKEKTIMNLKKLNK